MRLSIPLLHGGVLMAILSAPSNLQAASVAPPSADGVPHELHEPHPLPTAAANDVRALALDRRGRAWVATAAGVYRRDGAGSGWQTSAELSALGPAFALARGADDAVWIGAWNGLHRADDQGTRAIPGLEQPVAAVAIASDGALLVGGPDGYHLLRDGIIRKTNLAATRYLSAIIADATTDRGWLLATAMGVHAWNEGSATGAYWVSDRTRDRVSLNVRGLAVDADGRVWAAALGGLQEFRRGRWTRSIDAGEGLPSDDVRCLAFDPRRRLWVGTARGLARRDGRQWTVRAGRRWLLDDEVRALAFEPDGTAWVATAGGVSVLRSVSVTLEEKARRFHEILEARHVRPPGIVEKCRLRTAGDVATWAPMDDDNDGGYTALALAMESYRYAATRDPAARAAAERAFAACEFLQRVTGTPGFLARTVVPADWTEVHDPNEEIPEPKWAEERVGDPRNKRVPVRWRPSADGVWRWKGDTSSDEVTAHFYGYWVFHEHAADPAQRRRVREQVCRIVDHLIDHGFCLTDLDGRPTRWGIWAPERLNDDPDWAMERGINSVEILSFLKLARHVSGDAKYEHHYRRLIEDHRYDRNVLEAPNLNPAWRTHIDLELLAFAYPALLTLETDPRLARVYRASFERWHRAVAPNGNPFFEYLHAAHTDVGGGRALGRSPSRMDAALAFLRDTPLDLIRWDVDLGRREDLRRRRSPEVEHWQVDRALPPSEIGYSRTDQNPWLASQGDGGRSESDGVFWLLPYWMGRFYGWVEGGG